MVVVLGGSRGLRSYIWLGWKAPQMWVGNPVDNFSDRGGWLQGVSGVGASIVAPFWLGWYLLRTFGDASVVVLVLLVAAVGMPVGLGVVGWRVHRVVVRMQWVRRWEVGIEDGGGDSGRCGGGLLWEIL